jgi:microcystin-dependent protein
MSEPFIGEIRAFGFNFAPRGWANCSGQLLPISQNTALFSLLGTTYGGDGRTTFALPDLRGRVAVNQGQGPGLRNYTIGEMSGEEAHTLTINEAPAHTHLLNATNAGGNQQTPQNTFIATDAAGNTAGFASGPPTVTMNQASLGISGGSQPHNNLSPYLAVNYCIALQGIFPSRN